MVDDGWWMMDGFLVFEFSFLIGEKGSESQRPSFRRDGKNGKNGTNEKNSTKAARKFETKLGTK